MKTESACIGAQITYTPGFDCTWSPFAGPCDNSFGDPIMAPEAENGGAAEIDAWVQDEVAKIAQQLEKGRVGFLLGSGMSIDAGGIPGKALAAELVRHAFMPRVRGDLSVEQAEIVQSIAGKYPLEAIADGAWPKLTFKQGDLAEVLKTAVFPGGAEIHKGHRWLADITQKFGVSMLFTTNWDNLIEKALSANVVSITEGSFRKLDGTIASGDVAVIHLHGTFEDEPLVCEKDLMDPSRPLFQVFLAELLSKAFVFVGYSLSDPNLRALYHHARGVLKSRRELDKTTYVVYPALNETEERVSTAVWEQRGATYIPLGALEFFGELHRQATEEVLVNLAKKIQERLEIKDTATLNGKIEEILGVFPEFGNREQVLRYLDGISRGAQR